MAAWGYEFYHSGARVALGYRLEQLLRFPLALQTSRVHHNSIIAR